MSGVVRRLLTRVRLLVGMCPEGSHRYGVNADCDECIEARYGG